MKTYTTPQVARNAIQHVSYDRIQDITSMRLHEKVHEYLWQIPQTATDHD